MVSAGKEGRHEASTCRGKTTIAKLVEPPRNASAKNTASGATTVARSAAIRKVGDKQGPRRSVTLRRGSYFFSLAARRGHTPDLLY
jgi:hypothetical protein